MEAGAKNILSNRELKILDLIAKGFTSKKIADELFIAETTVQTHRRNMLQKTGMKNAQAMLGWACEHQLLK